MIRKIFLIMLISQFPNSLFAQNLNEKQVEFLGKTLGGLYSCEEIITTTLGLDQNYNKFAKEGETLIRSIAKDNPKFIEYFEKSMSNSRNMDSEMDQIITCLPIASFIEGYYLAK